MRACMTGAPAKAQRSGFRGERRSKGAGVVFAYRHRRKRRQADFATTMRRIFGALAFLSFFFLLGSVGAVEQDTVELGRGCIQMAAGLAAFGLFTWLAGGFQ